MELTDELKSATERIIALYDEVEGLSRKLDALRIGEGDHRELAKALDAFALSTKMIGRIAHPAKARYWEIQLNTNPTWRPDVEDNAGKKKWAATWNEGLKEVGMSIMNDLGEPCILYVVGSRDGEGRYVLESRVTGKRSNACRSLTELMPVRLVPTKQD